MSSRMQPVPLMDAAATCSASASAGEGLVFAFSKHHRKLLVQGQHRQQRRQARRLAVASLTAARWPAAAENGQLLQQHSRESSLAQPGSSNSSDKCAHAVLVQFASIPFSKCSSSHQQQRSTVRKQQQSEHCTAAAATNNCEAQHFRKQPSPQQPQQNVLGFLSAHLGQAKLLFAGAMTAVVSRTAMAPLERVKMDLLLRDSSQSALQTAVRVYKNEGVAGFWKGNALNLLRTAPFKALNFFSFEVYSKLLQNSLCDCSSSARFVAGAMAGITATMICFPLDVLRTRMMAPGIKYGGPLCTLLGMARFEGLAALYAGWIPAIIGMALSGAIFYGTYGLLKSNYLARANSAVLLDTAQQQQQQQQQDTATLQLQQSLESSNCQPQKQQQLRKIQHELPVLYTLLYGAFAGAAAEVLLYPLEVLRRKMQLQSMAAAAANAITNNSWGAQQLLRQHGSKAAAAAAAGRAMPSTVAAVAAVGAQTAAASRILAACTAILQADGIAGFYAGLLPNMLQVLPSAALSYGTYESMKRLLDVQPA